MPERIVRIAEAVSITGKSRSSIYNALNPASPYYDPTFPKRVRTGHRSVGFRLSELEAWASTLERVEH